MTNRRDFLGIATGLVFAPKFGGWFRKGVGLWSFDNNSNTNALWTTTTHFDENNFFISDSALKEIIAMMKRKELRTRLTNIQLITEALYS